LPARPVAGLSAHQRGAGDVRLDQLKGAGKQIARGGAHAFRSMEITAARYGIEKLRRAL